MKTQFLIGFIYLIFISPELTAQTSSADSMEVLKKQSEQLERDYKINAYKLELAELENKNAALESDVKDAKMKAEKSRSASQLANTRLAASPSDKKLVNEAKSAANRAEKDLKDVKKAVAKQEKSLKEINDLRGKIGMEPKAAMITSDVVAAVPNPVVVAAAPVVVSRIDTVTVKTTAPARLTNEKTDAVSVNDQTVKTITERVVESTYRNYPQGSGQPSIIINNIIIPSDYEKRVTTEPAASRVVAQKAEMDNDPDYQEYLRWKKQKNKVVTVSSADEPAIVPVREQAAPMTFQERFGEKPVRKSGLWVIPVVGLHAADFKADFQNEKASGRTGWNAGLDFRMHVKRFFVQPGVHYFNSSLKFTSKDSLSGAPVLDGPRVHSLKVPVMLGLYLTKANSGFFKFNIKGGATGNYVLAVDRDNKGGFEKKDVEEFSYGLAAGMGLEFGIFTIDLSHEWGVSTFIKESKAKNNVLRATIGLKL